MRGMHSIRSGAFCTGECDQTCRRADSSTAVRHIVEHDRHCSNATVVAYLYSTQYLRISAEFDVVTQYRDRAPGMAITYRYSLAQCAVGADLYARVNENIAEVPNSQAWTDACLFRKTDAGDGLDQAKHGPIQRHPPFLAQAGGTLVKAASKTI